MGKKTLNFSTNYMVTVSANANNLFLFSGEDYNQFRNHKLINWQFAV